MAAVSCASFRRLFSLRFSGACSTAVRFDPAGAGAADARPLTALALATSSSALLRPADARHVAPPSRSSSISKA